MRMFDLLHQLWTRLLALGFHLLYHQLAPTYDVVSWLVSFGRWRQWQLAAMPFVRGKNILEVACGPGHLLIALNADGYNVAGADLSPQMVRLAQKQLQRKQIDIPLVLAPAQALPFESGSFDTILTTFPTEFIIDLKTIREAKRLVRENGRLVIVPEARLTGSSFPVLLLELLYRLTGQRNLPAELDSSQTTAAQFASFKTAGFNVHTRRVAQAGSVVIVLVAELDMKSG